MGEGGALLPVSGGEVLTVTQEGPGQQQELAHDGHNYHLAALARGTEPLGERAEDRVHPYRHEGRHVGIVRLGGVAE